MKFLATCSLLLMLMAGHVFAASECVFEEPLPVQTQGNLGICYAHTASLMMQSADPQRRPVSPLGLAILSPAGGLDFSHGSTPSTVFSNVKKVCSPEDVPFESGRDVVGTQIPILAVLENFFTSYKALHSGMSAANRAAVAERIRSRTMLNCLAIRLQNGQIGNMRDLMLTCSSPGVDVNPEFISMAENVLHALETEQKDYAAVLASYAPKCVANARSVSYSATKYQTKKKPHADVMAGIDKSLCAGRIVGANVCGYMMAPSPGQYNELRVQRGGSSANDSGICPPQIGATGQVDNFKHVVSIVKFRGSGATKQYLVQNSWGPICTLPNPVPTGMECEYENGVATGRTWISPDILLTQAYWMYTIN